MIQFLRGQKIYLDDNTLVLDVNGVGYELLISSFTAEKIRGEKDTKLWVYTAVKEDAIQLFGFRERMEREIFVSLLKVNGIGPKSAMNILSTTLPERLLQLIENKDVQSLSALPKVGKKTAEQIVLTLKGKVKALEINVTEATRPRQEIYSALTNLGFRANQVEEFLQHLPADITVEQGVRQGLSTLSGQGV